MTDLHPFQRAGLGFAPFALRSVQRHAGGGCAYCGNLISHRYVVCDVDGREFGVGCDCITKVACTGHHDPKMVREAKRLAAEAERAEWECRRQAAWNAIQGAPALFTDKPHPWKAHPATLRDDVLWRFGGYAPQAERRKAIVQVERALRDRLAAG